MHKAFGIVNSSGKNIWVDGMQAYRPIGAFSFSGRYSVIDFPISNLSNSGIDRIQVYTDDKPRSLVEHVGTGRHYNINSKSGDLQLLFSADSTNSNYNTDISAYLENYRFIERKSHPYVVIVPSYMVYTTDFSELLETHVESGADVTLLYHTVDNAKEAFLDCRYLNLNRQKGVESIELNHGNAKNRNIFMDTYIMKTDLFKELIHKAKKLSSMYTLADIINIACGELDVRAISHRGYFAAITDFKSYYDANMALIDIKAALSLFDEEWPIYTRTNDSCPTQYFDEAYAKNSVVSNGCLIEGTVEHSIIGRGCVIRKGAVVRNSILLSGSVVGEDVHLENQIVDKRAKITKVKEVISDPETPGYIRLDDVL